MVEHPKYNTELVNCQIMYRAWAPSFGLVMDYYLICHVMCAVKIRPLNALHMEKIYCIIIIASQ